MKLLTHAISGALLILLASLSANIYAVGAQSLWLPASYQELAPSLRQIALVVEEDERCVNVMRGTLHASSRREAPVFTVTCRGVDRRTFAVIVDGLTSDMVFQIDKPVEIKGFDEKRIEAAWQKCEEHLQKKTRFMHSMTRLQQGRPMPDSTQAGAVTFVLDFDAEDLQGKPLRYRATCFASNDVPAKLSIGPRPKP
jgi:hypothetical protein